MYLLTTSIEYHFVPVLSTIIFHFCQLLFYITEFLF
nr:MAG TPA: hypothetical protein [Caudoviricetes sp.]